MANEQVLTVSKLNEYADLVLKNDPRLRSIRVSGEISGFTHHPSGHLYFSLKDGSSAVSCAMWRSYAVKLKLVPKDGMKVILHGSVSIYQRDGRFQFIADSMQEEGLGEQYRELLLLKEKLDKEGVFKNRRPLPELPRCIGVATSKTGAAFKDIEKVIRSRFPTMNILLAPCSVQGANAPESICAALRALQSVEECDVIIVGRGGGAYEDLNAFNDERVARAIFESRVPVVSAVGHEIDFTLADHAADVRAITPTEAGQICCPSYDDKVRDLTLETDRAYFIVKDAIGRAQNDLKKLAGSSAMVNPRHSVDIKLERLKALYERLGNRMTGVLSKNESEFEKKLEKLKAMDPERVVNRGYAVVTDRNGMIIKSISELNRDDQIRLKMSGGTASAIILDTEG